MRAEEDQRKDAQLLDNADLENVLNGQKLRTVSLLHQAISARHERIERLLALQLALG